MLRRIIRKIAVFVFYTGLIIYVLMHCFLDLLINSFPDTKIAKFIFLTQKRLERYTESITIKIIRKLEKGGMWY